jgi:hypothetical protein
VTVVDGFDREVDSFNFKDDERLASGASTSGGFSFEDNPFLKDELYDKVSPLVAGHTAKYRVVVHEVAFDDGSTLPSTSK